MFKILCCWPVNPTKYNSVFSCFISFQKYIFFLLCLLFSPLVFSNDTNDEEELNKLLALLNQQTSIATRTQLNADYVPGMVSIMSGEEMQHRGFATLWDALAYLPGIQLNMDSTGKRNIIVRGLGKASETSKIKIQLNNISLNQSISSASETLFDTPVKQIDKIEFVRGPGSAIHGEYALMGVLNVITYKHGKAVSAGSTSSGEKSVSALYEFGADNYHGLRASINLAATQTDGEKITVASDKTVASINGYAPGPINNKKDTLSAIFDMSVSDVDLTLQYQQSNRGDFYGVNNYLPPPQKQTVISDTVISFRIADNFHITDTLNGQLSYTHLINSTQKNKQFLGVAEVYGGLSNQGDIVSDIDQQEQRGTLALNLQYQLDAHELFMEISASKISVDKSRQYINLDPISHLPDSGMNLFPTPVDEAQQRTINSLVLQDEYTINDALNLTAGLRYDDFDNEYTHVSPRMAMVWMLSNEHILKFQYAEAFRPPSLREVGGAVNSSIVPETNQTTEISYIFNREELVIRNTLYYSKIDDYISFKNSAPYGYTNIGGAKLTGYELEFEEKLTPYLFLKSNLTLQNSRDLTTDKDLYGSTPVIFTLSSQYKISPRSELNLQIKTMANQNRESADKRDDLDSVSEADFTLTRKKLFNIDGLIFSGGVRNVFQQDIKYLAPENTYPDDYLITSDATLWLALEYRQ